MLKQKSLILFLLLFLGKLCYAQIVPILSYSINNFGQVQLEIEAQADNYYLLHTIHDPNASYESITSITMGIDGNMFISEPLAAFVQQNYNITEHSILNPDDADGDGIDDISEFNNMPNQAPLNFAPEVPFTDGTTSVNTAEVYSQLAVVSEDIPWAPFLNDREFAKFAIVNQNTDEPEVYFINSNTHAIHADFLATINVDGYADGVTKGEIVYNPNEIQANGAIGQYLFNYSFGDAYSFKVTRRTYELLAANMPFLQNNLVHFIAENAEVQYENNFKDDYAGSRLEVVLESDFFADVDFIPFNKAEGFGFFKKMELDENPGSRDIVLYDALPNSLPRVGGIITSIVQTPLSHVNLRAIQDNVPNAYIKDPLQIDSIANLIGKYIYYKVDDEKYEIREATLEEVNDWYEKLRPTVPQIPERDLSQTKILPLDEIEFSMSTSFGAKCTNVATMRKFGFPDGTIPNGFGIPFYFYDEFMKFNGFYQKVEDMITDAEFNTDLELRIETLKDFRKEIKDADMPQWMLDELQSMHDSFPEGTSVRCRSSTNNEDLPGFSGAGLYTSKTQHPEEGHISKSVKQIYASMWNFRAYDERDFYRVDQYIAAMGILCHPNFEEEKSNGVGVSIDPIYQTEGNFYLNTQVGEFLITNPEANSIPEEILLSEDPDKGFIVLRNSNLVANGQLVMGVEYLDQMRDYLKVIHDGFAILYNVVGAEGFGMDIEYKVTKDDQLIIKQARPWVSFWADIKANSDLGVIKITQPQNSSSLGTGELVSTTIKNKGLEEMKDFEISLLIEDVLVETIEITDVLAIQNSADYQFTIPQDFSTIGDYNIAVIVSHPDDGYERNDTLRTVISNLNLLEAGISSLSASPKCGEEVQLKAKVKNYGEATFTNTQIEVVVNAMVVDTFIYDNSIPYLAEVDVTTSVTDNLKETDNEIVLNLLSVNGEIDAILDNNSSSTNVDLDPSLDYITLAIVADEFPTETSWAIFDAAINNVIESGSLSDGDDFVTIDICLDYDACYFLLVYDSYGDGIFNGGGLTVLNSSSEMIANIDGDFGSFAKASFCPNGIECLLTAEILSTNESIQGAMDGSITVNASDGTEPYMYSFDAGQSFSSANVINNLSAGIYTIIVEDVLGCAYEVEVEINFDMLNNSSQISSNLLKIYPNPTTGNLFIETKGEMNFNNDFEIDIYSVLGKLIKTHSINRSNGNRKIMISLEDYPAGSYLAKCYNKDFETYFKIVKM